MISKDILKYAHHHGFGEGKIYGAYKIFFGTLVSESRLRIINLLRKRGMNVSDIIEELGIGQTAVSHDLARLRNCGFVNTERKGKFVHYKLNEETIRPLMNLIDGHMDQYCMHILHEKGGEDNGK